MPRSTNIGYLGALLCFLGSVFSIVPNVVLPKNTDENAHFDWKKIVPSTNLNYQDCYEGFECARLSFPLDWHNASNPNNVSLAVIRLPATVPEDDPGHGGSIILNPGGPGGSGILFALGVSRKMQQLLDGSKHYEIVSFDPRGVFHSSPNTFCFQTAFESEMWWREKRAAGNLDSSEGVLRYHWAMEQARGRVCADSQSGRLDDGDNIRRYLSTAYVARDMLEIIRKIEERKATVVRSRSQDLEQTLLSSNDSPIQTAKLQYIGGSYGTFLGQTFASLYPESVRRMILDSNIDADNWTSRDEASVDDHEAVRDYFFEQCFHSRSRCAFWRTEDSAPSDIKDRYSAGKETLRHNPVSVSQHGHATVITPDELTWGFFTTLYQPLRFFDAFARFLNDLHNNIEPAQPFWQHPVPTYDKNMDEVLVHNLHSQEVGSAIDCSDGPDLSNSTLKEVKQYLNNLTTRFPNAGAIQAEYKMSCWTWPSALRTKWRYSGPFNGSLPILFVNNRLDPVTPLKNAVKMSTRFHGSSVLVQNNVGHGALWPAGKCVWEHVRRYMQDGELPSNGKVCSFPCAPFGKECSEGLATEASCMQ